MAANRSQSTLSASPPEDTAADTDSRCDVHFPRGMSDILSEHAKRRDKSRSTVPDATGNHLVGLAGEVATAVYFGGDVDLSQYPRGQGDGGVDVEINSGGITKQYQVKTTRNIENPEMTVSRDELSVCDRFVLCCTRSPKQHVQIIGVTNMSVVKEKGRCYGRDGYVLRPEILMPIDGRLLPSDVEEWISNRNERGCTETHCLSDSGHLDLYNWC